MTIAKGDIVSFDDIGAMEVPGHFPPFQGELRVVSISKFESIDKVYMLTNGFYYKRQHIKKEGVDYIK